MSDTIDRVHMSLLVLRCQTGDKAAFTELVRLYQTGLRFFLRSMMREAHSADDVFQEVWLEVFKGISKLTAPDAFPAWLYTIARHRVCRALRQQHLAMPRLDNIDPVDPRKPEVEFSAEDAVKVHEALGQLKPEQREVLLLRFLEDMSYEDIARILDCQVGTVRSRLHYAKLALRGVIERMEENE